MTVPHDRSGYVWAIAKVGERSVSAVRFEIPYVTRLSIVGSFF